MCPGMGVCRLFSKGGENFPRMWRQTRTTYLPKKHLKDTISLKKIDKYTILVGKGPLLPSPADAHVSRTTLDQGWTILSPAGYIGSTFVSPGPNVSKKNTSSMIIRNLGGPHVAPS